MAGSHSELRYGNHTSANIKLSLKVHLKFLKKFLLKNFEFLFGRKDLAFIIVEFKTFFFTSSYIVYMATIL